jgi:hypothetical protein
MKIHRKHGKVPIQDFKNLKIHYLCPFVENIGNMYLNAFKKTLRKTYFQNIGKANKNNQNGHTGLQTCLVYVDLRKCPQNIIQIKARHTNWQKCETSIKQ